VLNLELERNMEVVRRQVEEKELLIRETNHRVKNHMAQLAGLIDITEASGSPDVVGALRSRIYSYTFLYEKLSYRADSEGQLDLGNYVEDLSRRLIEVSAGGRPVSSRVDAEHAMVSARKCSAFGLVLNELVTNSIKYAVPAEGDLSLTVVARFAGGRVTLSYSDNGQGFDFEGMRGAELEGGHLGMVLIDTMLAQYGGSISYSREFGSRFEIGL
jgi:two-component sensor histidine kinase